MKKKTRKIFPRQGKKMRERIYLGTLKTDNFNICEDFSFQTHLFGMKFGKTWRCVQLPLFDERTEGQIKRK